MGKSKTAADPSVRVTFLEAIDSVCVAFEVTCQETGRPPRVEDYLDEYDGAERQWLFRELLLLELDYRRRWGEQPNYEEYRRRFPKDAEVVKRVFHRHADTIDTTGDRSTIHLQEPPPPPVVEDKQFGEYELLEELGKGGMGVVYRARQKGAERDVALKLVRPERLAVLRGDMKAEVTARFYAEIRTAAKLDHDHIVRVYDVGQLYDQPYFAMQFVQGRSLDGMLDEGPFGSKEAAVLLEPVCRAVAAAHESAIIHRDLKPKNILVDEAGKPYVADFGLAKLHDADQQLTQTGQLLGTPPYMSPEQAQGKTVNSASDIYSLGATLYEMLTGRPPFMAASIGETLRQIIYSEPAPPSQLNADVDRDMESICLKCLEKEPAQRYGSATELALDLQRYLGQENVAARPITPPIRAMRWCRRNPVVTALSGLSLLSVVTALIVACLGWYATSSKNREINDYVAANKGQGETLEEFFKRIGELREDVGDKENTIAILGEEKEQLQGDLITKDLELEVAKQDGEARAAELQSKLDDATAQIDVLQRQRTRQHVATNIAAAQKTPWTRRI